VTIICLALGSNVGDSRHHIEDAIELLGACVTNIVTAPMYVSKAVGYTDQADFFNTVITGKTHLTPHELLGFVKKIERQVGRVTRFRWGPREIDIDIIFYGDLSMQEPDLTIPHPRFRERDFVLEPLCKLSPAYIDPVSKQSVRALLERLPEDIRSILREV